MEPQNNNTQITINGIKCDNPNCDYSITDVKPNEYKNYVDVGCPKCNTILLSQQDLNFVTLMYGAIAMGNKIGETDTSSQIDAPPKLYKVGDKS